MKSVFVLFALVAVAFAGAQFDAYLKNFGKSYAGEQYKYRENVYMNNMAAARSLHEQSPSATFGETKFADLTEAEFAAAYLLPPFRVPNAPSHMVREPDAITCLPWGEYKRGEIPRAPADFDWSTQTTLPNVVWPVRDQGSCGSCWAFSTAQSIEGIMGVKGTPTSGPLSPQFIVDCSKSCSWEQYSGMNYTVCNQGCSGGWPWTAFWDVSKEIGGVPLESAYPYLGVNGMCRTPTGTTYGISGYTCISTWDGGAANEVSMMDVSYAQGPLSIAINANPFQLYTGGIIDIATCAANPLNHAVLVTGWGYDATKAKEFWNIKNSWGAAWGEKGYVRVVRGKGMCGVNEGVSIPLP